MIIRPVDSVEIQDKINLVVSDQQYLMTEAVDLILEEDNGDLIGFFISPADIFILAIGKRFNLDIAKLFLGYKSLDQAFIHHRGDIYPVRLDLPNLVPAPQYLEKDHLFQKMKEHLERFFISEASTGILYYLADRGNTDASDAVEWINKVRKHYQDKCDAVDNDLYYDYDYSTVGDLPKPIDEILAEPVRPTPIIQSNAEQIQFFCARNETWQNFSRANYITTIWDKILRQDPIFILNEGKDSITVHYTGWIELSFKQNFLNAENNRIGVRSFASLDLETMTETVCHAYIRSSKYINNGSCVCPPIVLPVVEGQIIRIHSEIQLNDSSFGDKAEVSMTYGESVITLKTVPELS